MRVLIVAYACEPDRGSEPAVGWNMALELADRFDVTVITRANNRALIEAAQAGPDRSLRFIYCDAPAWARFYKRGTRGVHLYLLVWQLLAFRLARRAHIATPFDVVHHVTFSAAWYPSVFGFLGPPFVWGPLACNQPVPRSLESRLLSRQERLVNRVRALLNGRVGRLNPLLHMARGRAVRLLVVNGFVASTFAARHRSKAVVVPAIGSADPGICAESVDDGGPMQVVMVGRQIGLKGTTLALEAIASIESAGRPHLRIVGDGPCRGALALEVTERSLTDHVTFLGALTHAEAIEEIRRGDVLLFPAFDAGGMVVVEAMALGKPVIALDTGGPSETVVAETGVLVPVGTAAQISEAIARALSELADDPRRRREMGFAARARFIDNYTWPARARQVGDVIAEAGSPS